jgi:hypothetical protein
MQFRAGEVPMRTSSRLLAGLVMIFFASYPVMADAQSSQTPAITLSSMQGTVVSASKSTIVVKSGENQYQVFVLDRSTARPQAIPLQAQVMVSFAPITGDQTPIADSVKITAPPPPQVAALTGEAPPPPVEDQVPGSVRSLENSIKRQTQKYRLGIRGATSLDPELFLFGVHSQMGPFFSDNVYARPNFELGFGELTTLAAFNFEGIYRLPVVQRTSRWNIYLGGGPALNWSHRNLNEETDRGKIDFGDMSLDVGFNFLLGLQSRDGIFLEMKTSAYSIPTLRFEIGYNF